MRSQALEGIRVVDFSWVATGPLITKYLADHGAEVIKVESMTSPDIARLSAPFKDKRPGLNRSGSFPAFNSSKLSITLNLKHPVGIEISRRLVSHSDVVVESFTPGKMESWGLGYEQLRRVKSDIIMLSVSIQGQTGPCAKHPGFGWNIAALCGFSHLIGWPDRPPVGPANPYPDNITPWFGVISILTALDQRRRTGIGQYIDLNQFEASLQFIAPALLNKVVNRRSECRIGNRSAMSAPHSAYRCKGEDKWCTIAVFSDQEWSTLCKFIGNSEWTMDAKFYTFSGRKCNEDELDKLMEACTVNFNASELMTLLQKVGVSACLVQSGKDLYEDPQLRFREHFKMLYHSELGECSHPTWPCKLSKTPSELRPAPLIGQHNEYLCTKVLGMSDTEFMKALEEGAFE